MAMSNSTMTQQLRFHTENVSPSGIRLLSNRALLGQLLRVTVPGGDGSERTHAVRILWTRKVGNDRYENGGSIVNRPSAAGPDAPPFSAYAMR